METKWWTLVAVCVGTFMLLLDVTIVVVALPDIQRALHASFSDVQWVVDAYALALASFLLTSGVLADRYGRRLLFLIGLVVFTAGSLLCGLAQSSLMLILSRAGQGVGGAIMFATSLALLGHSFRGRDRGVAFGVWGAITGAAVSLGPILGGLITTGISWRGIFLVNVPIGIAALAVTRWRVEESRAAHPGRLDVLGFVLLTFGLVGLVYGLIRAGETSWSDTGAITALAVGTALLVGFVVAEGTVKDPMFDLGLFRKPTFVGGLCAAFAMNGSLFAMLLYLVLYLQDVLGYSALATGARLLVNSGALLVAATVAGRLSERVSPRWLIGPGLLAVGAGLLLMTGLNGDSTWTDLIPGFIVSGLGAGFVNPPLASTAIGVVEPERAGMASGINSTFRQIGLATSIAALGSIFATSLRSRLGDALSGTPLAAHAGQILAAVRQGQVGAGSTAVPAALRGEVQSAIRSSFAGALNVLLVVTAVLALVGGVASALLIRDKDFIHRR
ncbi:MFS transporter [Streptacidiphilus jiangxiensis]|uniref:Drug resistance transporter, EmrB/QacA subfamily n=1 Tax=Streptacidiphilus jiangxiensis TaxID=235985 RepID=A0A1H7QTA7_STRJI|nr:MFS transporter [Streptacidiphilus jiangxiensis]SEL51196.1 drug resistance transporter, EmrB/QacA subfamily [Streptacidiphilus jiangxiensis]